MRLTDELLEIVHGTENRIDVGEITDVIAMIYHGWAINGTDPDCFNSQLIEIVQTTCQTCENKN